MNILTVVLGFIAGISIPLGAFIQHKQSLKSSAEQARRDDNQEDKGLALKELDALSKRLDSIHDQYQAEMRGMEHRHQAAVAILRMDVARLTRQVAVSEERADRAEAHFIECDDNLAVMKAEVQRLGGNL